MDTTGVKEMLSYLVGNLVEHPEEIRIEAVENGDSVVLQLRVAPTDMGKVIGRQGRIAKELRAILKALGQREEMRVTIDILD
jgi:predicted RNA-binding protein YlqC (UPF0109 family)